MDPPFTVETDPATWNDGVDMGVLLETLAPGVKNGGKSDPRVKPSFSHLLQGFRHRFEQDVEAHLFIGPDQSIEFVWHSEDNVKISDRKQFALSRFNPSDLG